MHRLAISMMVGGSLAAACADKKSLTADEVGRAMGVRLHEAGIRASNPTCPSVELSKGKTFECTIDVQGTAYTFTGKVSAVEGGKPKFEAVWKNGSNGVVLRMLAVPPLSEELFQHFGTTPNVVCPEPLIFLDDKRSTTCDFSTNGMKAKLTVTFDDKLKPTAWKLTPPLLPRKMLQAAILDDVKAKFGPTATIQCGENPLGQELVIVRPDDGKISCGLTGNENGKPSSRQVVIEVDLDGKVAGWNLR